MTKEEIKKILERQLQLLSEVEYHDVTDVCNATEAMINLTSCLASFD